VSSEYKVCPTCGTEYPANERFCPRDGTALRSPTQGTDLVGTVVAERYDVLRKLGEGGMGQVYLVEHLKMKRKSALKVMHPGMVHDTDAIARFNREAANAARINHPHVASIYDFGETPDGLIYLAMEFVEGQPLTKLIEQQGALPPARAAELTCQAGDALAVAHDMGIVHRDLKPDNIMIARNRDGSDCVKVVDFGIAKAAGSEAQKVTKTGLVVGTPEYMSPEQLSGDRLDGRSDIYSLALVAFNMLTGRLPFPSETVQEAMIMRLTDRPRTLAEMKPEVAWPPVVEQVMAKALARDARERYQNAAEFGRDLVRAVEQMPRSAAFGAPAGATAMVGGVTAMLPKTNVNAPARQSGTKAVDAGLAAAIGGGTEASGGVATRAVPVGGSAPAAATAAGTAASGGAAIEPPNRMPLIAGGIATAVLAVAVAAFALRGDGGAQGAAVTPDTAKSVAARRDSTPTVVAGGPDTAKRRDSLGGKTPGAGGEKGANGSGRAQNLKHEVTTPPPLPPLTAGEARAQLDRIDSLMKNPNATAEDGQRALDAITLLYPRLRRHDDRMVALLHKSQAFGLIDGEPTRACTVLAEILAQPTSSATEPAKEVHQQACSR